LIADGAASRDAPALLVTAGTGLDACGVDLPHAGRAPARGRGVCGHVHLMAASLSSPVDTLRSVRASALGHVRASCGFAQVFLSVASAM
jgi:hypothetical protein